MISQFNIKYLKGVGPKRADILSKLEIFTLKDILFYFPRGYEDRRIFKKESDFEFIDVDIVYGEVVDFFEVYTSTSLRIFKIILKTLNSQVECNVFKKANRNYDVFLNIKKNLIKGTKIFVVGKAEDEFFKRKISVEEIYFPDDPDFNIHADRIVPVYSLTSGINPKVFRKLVFNACSQSEYVNEIIDSDILVSRGLISRSSAIKNIHFPQNVFSLKNAMKRLIYEELFLMSMAWNLKKSQTKNINKQRRYEIKKKLLTPFKNNLGFEFTDSQKKAINDIFSDMRNPYPMTRLLQGDVGSGKTVVAISACLLAVENSGQCCFLAPTEILAEQHYMTFKKFLDGLPVRFEILTSSTPKKKKHEIISKLASGDIDIIIGTHALIEKEVRFKNLVLAVIDEQHKFGVRQRATLRQKGENIDMLIMTATPIPRTLFLALYGDLDVSFLKDMPKGRMPVKTFHLSRQQALDKTLEFLKKGVQAYIVFPIIDESDKLEIKSLLSEYGRLKEFFKGYNTQMIYGRMKGSEKQKIMSEFAEGKIHVLCATSVIEVGIDVPNANVMVIENAERFGLASLHQLRGRIGRGKDEAYCFLVSESKDHQAMERINAICQSTNGFELSEKDAYLRGIGEIMGTMQHGDMEFKIASLSRDREIFEMVIEDVNKILKEDPYLTKKEHLALRKELNEIYGKKWNIIDLN
ncbi:MAG: ATP-dependent DNA helicase RecG [Elusimicrobiota bacterium]